MNKLILHTAICSGLPFLIPQGQAVLLDSYGDPVTARGAGNISPADWFANESRKEAGWLQSTTSTEEVLAITTP